MSRNLSESSTGMIGKQRIASPSRGGAGASGEVEEFSTARGGRTTTPRGATSKIVGKEGKSTPRSDRVAQGESIAGGRRVASQRILWCGGTYPRGSQNFNQDEKVDGGGMVMPMMMVVMMERRDVDYKGSASDTSSDDSSSSDDDDFDSGRRGEGQEGCSTECKSGGGEKGDYFSCIFLEYLLLVVLKFNNLIFNLKQTYY